MKGHKTGSSSDRFISRIATLASIAVFMLIGSILVGYYGGSIFENNFVNSNSTSQAKLPRVRIGFLSAFTGGSSNMGYGENKGIRLAKKQLAADNIEILQEDSQCDPNVSPEAFKRLVAQKVIAVIGDGCSSASTAILPLANKNHIPLISPSASSPTLSIPNDYFFRVIPPDTFQGSYAATVAFNRGVRSMAIFFTDEPYGQAIKDIFKQKFEALGGKIVATVGAQSDSIGLSSQAKALVNSKPGALFIAPNSTVSATAIIRQTYSLGLRVPLFGGDILYDTTIVKDAPLETEGLIATSFPTGSQSFKQALVNEYQVTEQLYGAAQAYDTFRAIYLATQKGATTGEQIKSALEDISFRGVSGHITFDKNGEISDPKYKYDLLQVKDGTFISIDK
jgi:branched-chain amino acid transport system substrate-binding protein